MTPTLQAELLGLPEAGKSTFLCAVALAAESAQPTQLSKHSPTGNYHWVNSGIDALRSCKEIERTEQESEDEFHMELETADGSVIDLTVPDLSGEVVRAAMNRRGWPDDLAHRIRGADAIAVMISADRFEAPTTIRDVIRAIRAAGGEPDADADDGQSEDTDFGPEKAPTAAKLLDLLRTIELLREGTAAPVALLISAWDVVAADETPNGWVERNMPLVAQYLEQNSHLELRVFGVSSQGGSFAAEESRKRLLELPAEERLVLADGSTRSTDVTAPLAWLLSVAHV